MLSKAISVKGLRLRIWYEFKILPEEKDQTHTRMISKRSHALGFVLKVKELREPVHCAFPRLVVGSSGTREMWCDRRRVDALGAYGSHSPG
jgi:hypothetical protein